MEKTKKPQPAQYYSESFKLKVIEEVLSGKLSKAEANRLYGIRGKSSILEWTRKYSGEKGFDKRGRVLQRKKTTSKIKQQLSEQNKRILELEELLRIEKLKVSLSNTMIDIAEEEFGIEIRKKSGAKQFKESKQKKGKQ